MTIKYYMDLTQGTDEWFKVRTGILTASQMKLVLTPTLKIANNDKKRALVNEIIAQRAEDHIEETYQTWDMQRGNIEEIHAKDLYSEKYAQTKDCGFITNDKLGFTLGASPDFLIDNNEDGGGEVKSRNQKIQVKTIIEDEVPDLDMLQVQTTLFVSERKWWDYVSYSNGLPMYVKRVLPAPDYFEAIEAAAKQFEDQVQDGLKIYKENSEHLARAERRDYETGKTIIKPSKNEESVDYMMAG